jgi:hypothetical protein
MVGARVASYLPPGDVDNKLQSLAEGARRASAQLWAKPEA